MYSYFVIQLSDNVIQYISMKIKYSAIFLLIMFAFKAYSNEQAVDTTAVHEQYPDSLISIPSVTHGKIFHQDYNQFRTINKSDIQEINYVGLNDIISDFTPFYNQHLGGYSTYNSFLALGASSRGISWAYNGRNINNPILGSFNPEQHSPEFFENLEIFTGSDAVILGNNASSVFINIQEIRYNTGKPFTRLWFGNSGFGYLGADGVFSQNFRPNWNFTFGFKSYNSLGAYDNSWGNNWNARAILRWNPNDKTSISLTENYTNIGSGTSGGVDLSRSDDIYDRLTAVSVYTGLNERNFRNDLTLTASHKFDTVHYNALTVNLYLSTSVWDRNSGADYSFGPSDTSNSVFSNSFNYAGAEGRYEVEFFEMMKFRFGASAEYDFVNQSFLNDEFKGISSGLYSHASVNFSDSYSLSGGVRLNSQFAKTALAYGIKQKIQFSENLSLSSDFSYTDRIPYLAEGLHLDNEQHISLNGELSYIGDNGLRVSTGLFYRTVFSPVIFDIRRQSEKIQDKHYNGNEYSRFGVYADFSGTLVSDFGFRLRLLSQYGLDVNSNQLIDLPLLNGSAKIFYTYKPGRSMLRIGLEAGAISDFTGDQFFPLTRSYYQGDYGSGFMFSGLTAFAEIKIGDAYVKVQYRNLFSNNYYFVPINPMFPANLRLSANWTLNEN